MQGTPPNAAVASGEAQNELLAVLSIRSMIPALVINNQESFAFAADVLARIKGTTKQIQEKRDSFIESANEYVKSVRGFFNPVINAYEQAEEELKQRIAAYLTAEEEGRRAAMLAGGAAPPPSTADTISVRTKRKFRITDEAAVPREFCTPDLKKIKLACDLPGDFSGGHVRTTAWPAGIPGIEVYEDKIIASGAK